MSLKKLGRYDLIRVLGKGAMGLVYEGRDPNLDRRVAIKTIKVENLSAESAAEYEVRFRTEARSAARLQHPNIVSVYDSDRDGDIAFLVMEFIQGDDLKHHLDSGELYTLEQSLRIMEDLLSALGYAHRQAIVHRDIKPANLLLEPGGRVKLTDFGVARIQDSGDITRTQGTIVGTLKYMSPEQLQGRPIDARADLFAAGVVLYQLLTGKRPFDGDTDFAVIQQIVGHSPAAPTSFNPNLPPELDAVIGRSLAKARDERFSTAEEFALALRAACRDAADIKVVPPSSTSGRNDSATWTATLLAGESLLTQPGGAGASSSRSGGTSVSIVAQEVELVYWKDIKESVDIEEFEGFLQKFPSGIYADLARRRLKKLLALPDGSDIGFRPGNVVQPRIAVDAYVEATTLLVRPPPAQAPSAALSGASRGQQALEDTIAQSRARPFPEPALFAATANANKTALDPVAQAVAASPALAYPDAMHEGVQAPPAARASAEPMALDLSLATWTDAAKTTFVSRRTVWALAGIAAVVLAGVAFKVFTAGPAANPAAAAAQAPVSGAVGAAPGVQASKMAPLAAESPATLVPAQLAEPAQASPALLAASAAASAAVKKAAAEKKSVADRKVTADKKIATDKENAPAPAPEKKAPPTAAPAAERAAPVVAGNPRLACEDRMLLGFQICMTEQCAKPAFVRHPVCLERRAMDQRRRDAEQMNR